MDTVVGMKENPIPVSIEKPERNFKEALMGVKEKKHKEEEGSNRTIRPLAIPRYEGGNLVIDLDEGDYKRGVKELQYNVMGKPYFPKNCEHPTTVDIKKQVGADMEYCRLQAGAGWR